MTPPLALDERHAKSLSFDPQADVAKVIVGSGAIARRRTLEGTLLLDDRGLLVGLDLRDESGRGVVVMLGPHEAVSETRAHALEVHEDASREPMEVTLAGARNAIRAGEKNPYL